MKLRAVVGVLEVADFVSGQSMRLEGIVDRFRAQGFDHPPPFWCSYQDDEMKLILIRGLQSEDPSVQEGTLRIQETLLRQGLFQTCQLNRHRLLEAVRNPHAV